MLSCCWRRLEPKRQESDNRPEAVRIRLWHFTENLTGDGHRQHTRYARSISGSSDFRSILTERAMESLFPFHLTNFSDLMPVGSVHAGRCTAVTRAKCLKSFSRRPGSNGGSSNDNGNIAMPRRPAKVTQADIARRNPRRQGSWRERSHDRWRGRHSDHLGRRSINPLSKRRRSRMDTVGGVAAFPETHRKRLKRTLCN